MKVKEKIIPIINKYMVPLYPLDKKILPINKEKQKQIHLHVSIVCKIIINIKMI